MNVEVNVTKNLEGTYDINMFLDGDYLCAYEQITADEIGEYVSDEIKHREMMDSEVEK